MTHRKYVITFGATRDTARELAVVVESGEQSALLEQLLRGSEFVHGFQYDMTEPAPTPVTP